MKIGVNWKNILGIVVFVLSQQAMAGYKVITDRKPLGKGWVYSWTKYSNKKVPLELGLTVTGYAMKTAPDEMVMISLVPQKKHYVAPFKHFTIDWNPQGHEPMGIYTVPHYDFHFFTIPHHVVHNITCQGADAPNCMQAVAAPLLADNYAPTPEGVPMMGWHWVDVTSPEFNGQPFSSTFIYGYYKGKTAFLEPMVALSFLKAKPLITYPVKQQPAVSEDGYYPQSYRVDYNASNDTYNVVFTNLKYRTTGR